MKKKHFISLVILAVLLSVCVVPIAALAVSDNETIDLEDTSNDSYSFSNWSYDTSWNTFKISGDVTVKGTVLNTTTTMCLANGFTFIPRSMWKYRKNSE